MPKHASELTCEEFQKHIAELTNSGADPEHAERHPHAKACAICRQFLRDIEAINEAARSRFPDEWKAINQPN